VAISKMRQKQQPESMGESGSVRSGPAPYDKGRILVVDDSAGIRKLFKLILTVAMPDSEVDEAEDGATALAAFSHKHHGVLLLDLNMPVMDGQTAFRRIDEMCRERNWEMPSVVFCTGYAPPQTVKRIVDGSSCHCLLAKPVTEAKLVDAIRSRLAS